MKRLTAEIILIDQCVAPVIGKGITIHTNSDYTNEAVFTFPLNYVSPEICRVQAEYTCEYLSGPYPTDTQHDLCNFQISYVTSLYAYGSFDT